MKWDYSFFGGNAQMIQYLMYSLTAVLAFIVFGLTSGGSHYLYTVERR
jgi:hypothetical protein